MTPEQLMSLLNLQPLAGEGGYFASTYRSEERVKREALPSRYTSDRILSSAIYYLLTSDTFSALHRLPSDEIYHFYLGDPVEVLQLHPDGTGQVAVLGTQLMNGMRPQLLIPKHVWQGSKLLPGGSFALLGTTMAPGFEYSEWEGGSREYLSKLYPQFRDEIHARTHAE